MGSRDKGESDYELPSRSKDIDAIRRGLPTLGLQKRSRWSPSSASLILGVLTVAIGYLVLGGVVVTARREGNRLRRQLQSAQTQLETALQAGQQEKDGLTRRMSLLEKTIRDVGAREGRICEKLEHESWWYTREVRQLLADDPLPKDCTIP